MDSLSPEINGNVATIQFPAGAQVLVTAQASSPSPQSVTIIDGSDVHLTFEGSGKNGEEIGRSFFSGGSTVQITFTYQTLVPGLITYGDFSPAGRMDFGLVPNGPWANSRSLRSSGLNTRGDSNVLIMAAENGDDADYNDCVLTFSWYTSKN